jgi:hypothetical protein
MDDKLPRNDISFERLNAEIRELQNRASSKGWVFSGRYCEELCSLLLRDVERYAKERYSSLLNQIKSQKISSLSPSVLVKSIESDTKKRIANHVNILNHGITKTCGISGVSAENIFNNLRFEEKADGQIQKTCSELDGEYAEYLEWKARENEKLKISKNSFLSSIDVTFKMQLSV